MASHLVELVLIGLSVGLVMGITGAGGGVLAVPLLVLALDWDMTRAAPTALLAVCAAALLGAVIGLTQQVVRYRAAAFMGAFGAALAPLGIQLAHALPEAVLSVAFAAILAYVARSMLQAETVPVRSPHPCIVNPATGRFTWTLPCARALAVSGTAVGLLSGLFGVGGGFVLVPALSRATDLDMRSIVPTTLAVVALVSLASIATALSSGHLDISASLPFIAAALAGLLAGRVIAEKLPAQRSRQAFALLAAATALTLLARTIGSTLS
jgi:uncharacterized membrane protein YfcA